MASNAEKLPCDDVIMGSSNPSTWKLEDSFIQHNSTVAVDYNDVIMSPMASQITSIWTGCSAVCSGARQRKHQSSALLAFVRGIHRWPVGSPHKGPITRKMFHLMTSSWLMVWQRKERRLRQPCYWSNLRGIFRFQKNFSPGPWNISGSRCFFE